MGIPDFERTVKVPVGPAQEGPHDDQVDPQQDPAEAEEGDEEFTFGEAVEPGGRPVRVQVRQRHQPHDDQRRKHHAGQPGIEIDQHFLKGQEIPGRLGRVGGQGRVGRLFEWGLQVQRPDDDPRHAQDHGNQLQVEHVRPYHHLAPAGFTVFARRLALRQADIVVPGLMHGEPQEERRAENENDDRDVVGLGDDQPEVGVTAGHDQGHDHDGMQDQAAEGCPEAVDLQSFVPLFKPCRRRDDKEERHQQDRKTDPGVRNKINELFQRLGLPLLAIPVMRMVLARARADPRCCRLFGCARNAPP